VKVRDGDSIVVLNDNEQVEIRLDGIDCPELGKRSAREPNRPRSILSEARP